LLMVYQLYCASIKIASELKNRYDYNQLLKVIKGGRDYSSRKYWTLDLLFVFIAGVNLLSTKLNGYVLALIVWLLFVSTTEVAILASLCEANYFLVDIELLGEGRYNNFIRIIPGPPSDYGGILVNRNHIISIKFKSSKSRIEKIEKESSENKPNCSIC
ncbi:MAG: hypothetical protein J7L20_06240, partial [Thermoplasmata archaeon]|nr:hypothetical protein [Thermoplasmata archaeon]